MGHESGAYTLKKANLLIYIILFIILSFAVLDGLRDTFFDSKVLSYSKDIIPFVLLFLLTVIKKPRY